MSAAGVPEETKIVVEYPGELESSDGILTALVRRLAGELRFDSLELDEGEGPLGGRITLWFRYGAKRIFHVSVVRKTGRTLVELGGLDPGDVLRAIASCRTHFDRLLGIEPEQVRSFESSLRP
ncbi:MAG: hypothetical protein ABI333_13750 [bacterium]